MLDIPVTLKMSWKEDLIGIFAIELLKSSRSESEMHIGVIFAAAISASAASH